MSKSPLTESSIPVLNFLVFTIPSPDNTSDSMSTSINNNKNFFEIILYFCDLLKEGKRILKFGSGSTEFSLENVSFTFYLVIY